MASRRDQLLDTLGLGREAGTEEIKGAYRRLVKEYHPDRHPGVSPADREARARRFLEIQAAYEALLHPARRVRRRRRRDRWPLVWLLVPFALAGLVVWLLMLLLGS